ncbi:MAG: site-2 protease family protein [Myxococcaceae bacterium]|nr:site-2 protease family protein [Myxococcaceae bacterium]
MHTATTRARAPGLRFGRLFGVELFVDWSVLLVGALITFNLGAGLFRFWHPGWSDAERWVTAGAAAVLFFASVLAHELAHAAMGRLTGVKVDRITLFIFGGHAHLHGEPKRPLIELSISGIGPLVSLAIGIGATALGMGLSGTYELDWGNSEQAELVVSAMGPFATLLMWLGPVNVALALFNLLPGLPLDGGRVLRAIFWAATRDFDKATRWASRCGQLVGAGLVALGVLELLGGRLGPGIGFALIGWFLFSAARFTHRQAREREAFAAVPISRLMRTQMGRVPPQLAVDTFVSEHLMATDQRAWPVEAYGQFVGLVVWDDVRRLPQSAWAHTAVRELMTPRSRLVAMKPGEPAERALELFAERDVDQIPIVEGARLLGLVRRADLLKWYALQGGDDRRPTFMRPVSS